MRKNDLQIEGQMNIFDFLTDESPPETNYDNSHTKEEAVQQSKEFPKIPSTDEIPSKSWHYAAIEQPKKEDIYYIAKYLNNDNDYFSYVYAAYFKGTWWHWNHWEKKWQAYSEDEFSRSYRPESIIAWVEIPSEFNNDPHLNEIRGLKGIVR